MAAWLRIVGLIASSALACSRAGTRSAPSDAGVIARFEGVVVTEVDLSDGLRKLPPNLRQQFDSQVGRREFVRSLIDRRLLVEEAERQGLGTDPEIERQVRELRERLLVQALMAKEASAAGGSQATALRAYYEAHKQDFVQAERLRLGRVLARVAPNATPTEKAKARRRVELAAIRLRGGESLLQVARQGDGPERERGGELGRLTREELAKMGLDAPALSLVGPGAISAVVTEPEGFSVLVLIERLGSRIAPFEEVRETLAGRTAPTFQREILETVLRRLRPAGAIEIVASQHP
jgi:PPIC-type PPIASE domain